MTSKKFGKMIFGHPRNCLLRRIIVCELFRMAGAGKGRVSSGCHGDEPEQEPCAIGIVDARYEISLLFFAQPQDDCSGLGDNRSSFSLSAGTRAVGQIDR